MFFGNDSFSLATLKALHQSMQSSGSVSKLEVCTSFESGGTSRDRSFNVVSKFCDTVGVPQHKWPPPLLLQDDPQFDIGVVASFGKLITKKVISSFPLGVLNVHGSLLPRWRGASPISHAIMAGDTQTGISIMEILPHHFDTGRVLAQRAIDIHPEQTRDELADAMGAIGAELMLEVLENLDQYWDRALEQDESLVTYAPKIDKSMFEIDWHKLTALEVYNRWRALTGLKGKLHSTWADTRNVVRFDEGVRPEVISDLRIEVNGGQNCPRQTGQIFTPGRTVYVKRGKNRFLCIKCASGWVGFRRVTVDKGKSMNAVGFYNGYINQHRDREQYFQTNPDVSDDQ